MADTARTETETAAQGGGTALFVRRPVLALVLNLLILIAGLAGLRGSEIRELPNVDNPVITIRTDYPGAAPETIDRELTAVVEGAAARAPGVKSISSSSSFGQSAVTVEFNDTVDISNAASDIRDALGRLANNMPESAEDPRIIKADANAQAVMRLAMTSDTMSVQDMTIFIEDEVADRLAAVPGVADVSIFGDREKIFRIDVNQVRLAALGLSVADLGRALTNIAYDVPAGSLTANSQDIVVRATATVASAEDFEGLYINEHVQIRDVASVTLGPDPGDSVMRANGKAGLGIGIVRQAGSNTLDISNGVRGVVGELRAILPPGTDLRVTGDDSTFIASAIAEVVRSLFLAIAIVVGIIFLFLLDWRATIIPAVTLPVALTGTFAAIYLLGFSVNILTLLALVLATGMVVDDAIVVLENIVRKRNDGMGVLAAAVIGTQEVFFAVVASTATLVSVFVPLSFLPGQAGALFREFGFVLACSITLSGVVALTLCPMLASRIIREGAQGAGREKGEEKAARPGILRQTGARAASLYLALAHKTLDRPLATLLVSAGVALAAYFLLGRIPQELTPREDRAVALLRVSAPQGVSLDYMARQMREIERLVEPIRQSGEARSVFSLAGSGGSSNSGFMVLTLAPWNERQRSQDQIVNDINRRVAEVAGVRAFAIQPNSLGIRGAGNGLQVAIAGGDYAELGEAAAKLAHKLEDDPRFAQVRLSYQTTQPQLSVEIDRERAMDLGVDIDGLASAVQALLDGRKIGQVFIGDRAFPVKLVSTTMPVNDPTDLESIYLKAGDGRMVPLSTIATLTEKAVAPSLNREQQLRSVSLTTGLAEGFALGNAYAAVVELAGPLLPPGARVIPLAEAATLEKSSRDMLMTFGVAILVVLLVLAAQFESFISAAIIMLTVPMGLACAVFALYVTGGTLNVYSQIGLVILVGIMAKNGILVVEFANQMRNRGMAVRPAIERALAIRLRPVVMTMLSTVLGALPLVLAHGAGAEAREALGWIIVGGLGLATLSTLFVTPAAYMLLAPLTQPSIAQADRLKTELADAARVGH